MTNNDKNLLTCAFALIALIVLYCFAVCEPLFKCTGSRYIDVTVAKGNDYELFVILPDKEIRHYTDAAIVNKYKNGDTAKFSQVYLENYFGFNQKSKFYEAFE